MHIRATKNTGASKEDVAEAKRRGVFVIPTSTVLQGVTKHNSVEALLNDPALKDHIAPWSVQRLKTKYQLGTDWIDYEKLKANTLALHQAGVPILAGSDSPNPATAHGVSLHHLCTWHDVLAVAREQEAFDANTLGEVEAFLADPRAWQAARS